MEFKFDVFRFYLQLYTVTEIMNLCHYLLQQTLHYLHSFKHTKLGPRFFLSLLCLCYLNPTPTRTPNTLPQAFHYSGDTDTLFHVFLQEMAVSNISYAFNNTQAHRPGFIS